VQQILTGGLDGDSFPLRDGDNLIGRGAGELSFPGDGYVSSRHAMLTVHADQVVLKDLGSSNGTFVRMDAETGISPGDLLLIGEQLLRVDAV
jgi:pSer/pThr/pTyr-binding forkhead associated (FHA) protein